jgi:hypothetical protein
LYSTGTYRASCKRLGVPYARVENCRWDSIPLDRPRPGGSAGRRSRSATSRSMRSSLLEARPQSATASTRKNPTTTAAPNPMRRPIITLVSPPSNTSWLRFGFPHRARAKPLTAMMRGGGDPAEKRSTPTRQRVDEQRLRVTDPVLRFFVGTKSGTKFFLLTTEREAFGSSRRIERLPGLDYKRPANPTLFPSEGGIEGARSDHARLR